jgi:hypothetical protein
MEIRICSVCERAYFVLANSCETHCSPACCRKADCPQAKPKYMPAPRRCKVCGLSSVPGKWGGWERFAPCDEGCTRFYYHSEQIYRCLVHHPNGKPRIHRDYCSIKCYNSETKGAAETRRQQRRRHRASRNVYKRGQRELGREQGQKEWWTPASPSLRR